MINVSACMATIALLVTPALAGRYALVVGNNHALAGSGYDRLDYADDDALRFASLLEDLGADVQLLTGPDADTAAAFPGLADRAQPPTRAHLLAALARLRAQVAADPEAEVFVYFSGHGSLTAASAHLHLLDAPFSRTDLHEHLLRGLADARRVHLIIDSCHAWFLVNARGARVAVAQDEESLDRYPQVGFLLSTSRGKEVHEWSGYRAGVFSHQLLSALRGAADVDGDGRVTYAEAHAWLVAANLGVTDARARIEPHVRRPAVRGDTLVTLPADRVAVPDELAGHLWIEGAEGQRLLDAHKAAGIPMALRLPPGPAHLVLADRRWSLSSAGRFEPEAPGAGGVAQRGTLADQFRERLFLRPFTPEFVAGFDAGSQAWTSGSALPPPAVPWHDDPVTLGLLGGGAVGLIAGAALTPLYLDAADDADRRPVTASTEDAASRATKLQLGMVAGYAAGGALLLGGLLRLWLDDAPGAGPGAGSGAPPLGISW
ncbi:MAG: caspase family protein [bacterium]